MSELLDGFYSLGKRINKAISGQLSPERDEGIVSDKLPELKLDMENEQLVALTQKWNKKWIESEVFAEWDKHGEDNENYWKGKQFNQPKVDKSRPLIDNVIFEALETYLPQITKRNPDPMVDLDDEEDQDPDHIKFAKNLKKKLAKIADKIKLRLKLKKVGRHWAIYLLGAGKVGWDLDKDIPTYKWVRAKKLILDPDSTNDEEGYTGKYVGEYRKMEAGMMIQMLNHIEGEEGYEKAITELVGDDLGTEVQFIEWWTDEYMFWTLGKTVLLKKKNPHWNYDKEVSAPADDQTGETPTDTEGNEQTTTEPAFNHFETPRKPYLFLTVFNLGTSPVDETSLMGQNLASQDLINKRVQQTDKNVDSQNGGMVVSLERSGLTQQQAKGVTEALRKGGTVAVATGAVGEAIARMSAPALPVDVYNQLTDTRNRVRDIFGVRGSSAAGLHTEKTVRGKIQDQTLDTDRIGGMVSEYLEQHADDIYNWFVQLLYVYDENYQGEHPVVNVGVKEGSLLPKDSTTIANQAIDLAEAGKMSLIDMYKAIDKPNPEELAANVWLEANAPDVLYKDDPRIAQVIQAKQAAAQQAAAGAAAKPISESINFKDLPPEGKAQMAAKAGIQLHPEGIAAHEEHSIARERSIPAPATPEAANPSGG